MCVCFFFLNVPALVLRRDDADRQWAGPQQNRLNVQHIVTIPDMISQWMLACSV